MGFRVFLMGFKFKVQAFYKAYGLEFRLSIRFRV